MADIYPKEVNVNEKDIAKLTKVFKRAYIDIFNEIETATDWGVENRKQILAQIEGILTNLGVDVYDFVSNELPKYYKAGAADAIKQLHNIGADVTTAEGFNHIHMEAIKALVDDTAKAFGESMTGVARSADLILGKATRELMTQQLAKGFIGGEALDTVRKMIKATIREQGMTALIDKAGHSWTLDRYAEMLIRTKAVEARNRGLANRAAENGYDLVQVSSNQTTHQECAVWEGKILSLTGRTPGYPTVADAEAAGLFHPNCKHALNILAPSLARLTQAYNPDTGMYGAPGESLNRSSNPGSPTPPKTPPKSSPPAPPVSHSITIEAGKKSATVTDLHGWEKELMDKFELKVQSVTMRNAYGRGVIQSGKWLGIDINTTAIFRDFGATPEEYAKHITRTFYHELGHFVDFKVSDGGRLTTMRDTLEVLRADAKQVILARLRNSYLNEQSGWQTVWGVTEDDISNLAEGRTIKITNKAGLTTNYKITRALYNYYQSPTEIFADGYAQYRTNPEEFKKYAPKMFDYFERIGGNNGR